MTLTMSEPELPARPRARTRHAAGQIDATELDEKIARLLNRRPAIGLAVGVVRDGRLAYFHGHGFANVEKRTPITEATVFRIASITKTVTAIAVMQLVEQGLVDLDEPASEYLRSFRLVPAGGGFQPVTARHLLTHTGGVPQVIRPLRALRHLTGINAGETFAVGEPMPTLAQYYAGALQLVAEPGTTFSYTDHGFAILGQIVEDVSGKPLHRYLHEKIFEPLGMADTDLLRSAAVEARLATGYAFGANGVRPITDREGITAAAGSIYSTPRDIARYLAALLGGGANQHGSMLRPETLALMFEPQYRTDPRLPGIGLAFFRMTIDGHDVVEHQGLMPGFNSQIFVAPGDGAAVMAFTNGAAGALMWLAPETGRLLGHVIGASEEAVRTDVPHHPEVWPDICGWYPVHARLTDTQAWGMLGLGVEVFVRGGRPMLRVLHVVPSLYRGLPLHPDDPADPYAFRIDLSEYGIGTARVVFSRQSAGEVRVHTDILPRSLRREPAIRNPRPWITRALPAMGAVAAVGAVRRRRSARPREAVL